MIPMYTLIRVATLLSIGLSSLAAAAVPVAPYFNGKFPIQAPNSAGWDTANAFPLLIFVDPMWISEVPGTGDMCVVGKDGRIVRFPNTPAAAPADVAVVLDLSAKLQISEDQGLYRLIFHPRFGQAGSAHANEVFACYSHRPASASAGPDSSMWRLSRFTWQPATGTIDPASEVVLMQQYDPNRWHNGGSLQFDNRGFLLVTCGDGGAANDSLGKSQQLNNGLFGGVLRIDVDNDPARSHPIRRQPAATQPATFPVNMTQGYGIPNDNPWLDPAGGILEEFFAIGLRSPHAAHYDPVADELWEGDVGQSAREELNRIRRGGNFQWPFMEGTIAGQKSRTEFTIVGVETPPVYSYDRTLGGCIIGGMRYRGAKWAQQLGGRVLFGDNIKGTLSALTPDPVEGPPVVTLLLSNFGTGIYSGLANIATDSAGEIYLMKLNGQSQNGGIIRKLVAGGVTPEPPQLLSATGLFTDTANLVPSPALVPYDVASPLWSDGAKKQRWIALPNDGTRNVVSEKIAWSATGNWKFPAGTVFVKHFEMPVDDRDSSLVRRLETRVIVCTANDGKYGVTYRWNEQGTDAVLISVGEEDTYGVTRADGSTVQRTWSFPSRSDCMQCHTNASGQSLGLRTHQINRTVIQPGTDVPVNQLSWFNSEAMFDSTLQYYDLNAALEGRPTDDTTAPLEHRVRSYLDSNCAHCHQPGGSVPYFDLRLQTPLKNQGLVNAAIQGQFQLPGGCYLKPGNPSLSAVAVRNASTAPGTAMPPLGKHMANDPAVAMISQYISGLSAAEFATDPAPSARYVRFTSTSAATTLMTVGELAVLDGNGTAIPRSGISISNFTSEQTAGSSAAVIDGDPWTFWSTTATGSLPKSITLDLSTSRQIGGFEYTPRQDSTVGRPRQYQVHYSPDGINWTLMVSKNLGTSPTEAIERFDSLVGRRPVRCSIAAAPATVARDFPVTIVFDSAVTDFTSYDLAITGGSVQSLSGSGYYYVATIRAYQPNVTVSLPANVVNQGTYGNPASPTLSVTSGLQTPPVPTFTSGPYYRDAFEVGLSFDQSNTGLAKDDFSVTGGAVEWLIPDGNGWRMIVVPSGTGSVNVNVRTGAVIGSGGLRSTGIIPFTFSYQASLTESEAEAMTGNPVFKYVADPSARGGAYKWTEEGSRGAASTLDTFLYLQRTIAVPYAGNYRVRGWTRADDPASNSFFISLKNSGGNIIPWQTNQGPGEIGSGQFHAGFARDTGSDHVFPLAAGSASLYIYAGEDGTRLDRVALIPERPFAIWSGIKVSSSPVTTAALHFTSPVTGLSAGDFETIDGEVTALTGSAQDYNVSVRPNSGQMVVRLRENSVTDEFGASNTVSDWHFARLLDTYDQWATDHGLSALPANDGLDMDGDGLGQFMEYAIGLDPAKADLRTIDPADSAARGLPKIQVNPTGNLHRLSLVFDRRRGGTPLLHTAGFTSDFLNYSEQSDFTGHIETLDSQWERVTAADITATGSEPARFGRLKIERAK